MVARSDLELLKTEGRADLVVELQRFGAKEMSECVVGERLDGEGEHAKNAPRREDIQRWGFAGK